MRNFITNLFHVIGIIFFIVVLWLLLELTGFIPAMTKMWGVMNAAGH